MGVYDQTARYAAKLKPEAFFRWAVPRFAAHNRFVRWADTRTVPFPREPDRVCDTVAEFVSLTDANARKLVDFEFQAELDSDILERLGEYAIRLRSEIRAGPGQAGKFLVYSVLLNLTGPVQEDHLDMRDDDLDGGHFLKTTVWTLREEDAVQTLAKIGKGELDLCILVWIPLMRGADDPATIQEWRRLGEQETDGRLRGEYGALALIFAELSERSEVWKKGLEGWNVQESQQVLEWKREAEQKLARSHIRELLEERFHTPLPEDLETLITEMNDLAELSRWFKKAIHADSLDAFRAALQA